MHEFAVTRERHVQALVHTEGREALEQGDLADRAHLGLQLAHTG